MTILCHYLVGRGVGEANLANTTKFTGFLELREAFKKKTAIIVTLSLSHFTPTLPKEIGTVIIGTKSM